MASDTDRPDPARNMLRSNATRFGAACPVGKVEGEDRAMVRSGKGLAPATVRAAMYILLAPAPAAEAALPVAGEIRMVPAGAAAPRVLAPAALRPAHRSHNCGRSQYRRAGRARRDRQNCRHNRQNSSAMAARWRDGPSRSRCPGDRSRWGNPPPRVARPASRPKLRGAVPRSTRGRNRRRCGRARRPDRSRSRSRRRHSRCASGRGSQSHIPRARAAMPARRLTTPAHNARPGRRPGSAP